MLEIGGHPSAQFIAILDILHRDRSNQGMADILHFIVTANQRGEIDKRQRHYQQQRDKHQCFYRHTASLNTAARESIQFQTLSPELKPLGFGRCTSSRVHSTEESLTRVMRVLPSIRSLLVAIAPVSFPRLRPRRAIVQSKGAIEALWWLHWLTPDCVTATVAKNVQGARSDQPLA
ncbi:hypothetical protein [Vibrio vulnificus YJ016]|uniref:Uncharacterized protein n=1 Tax=Vibrio vulnificus (strain YJ016) TaxID=196600 RepID=Q7MK09_VIBVY|nr:hypothetical protein [Vibrio vulnificus YJ016]